MKGKYESFTFFSCYSTFGVHKTERVIFVVTLFLYFSAFSECQSNSISGVGNGTVNGTMHFDSSKPLSTALSSSQEDYYDYDDNNSTGSGTWRRHDNSKLAQVVIYISVILIALGGILIKYFVTQYETSQIKAQEQLNYHRLDNQIA